MWTQARAQAHGHVDAVDAVVQNAALPAPPPRELLFGQYQRDFGHDEQQQASWELGWVVHKVVLTPNESTQVY